MFGRNQKGLINRACDRLNKCHPPTPGKGVYIYEHVFFRGKRYFADTIKLRILMCILDYPGEPSIIISVFRNWKQKKVRDIMMEACVKERKSWGCCWL